MPAYDRYALPYEVTIGIGNIHITMKSIIQAPTQYRTAAAGLFLWIFGAVREGKKGVADAFALCQPPRHRQPQWNHVTQRCAAAAPIRDKDSGFTSDCNTKTIVVIGGGWAGFSAADALRACYCKKIKDDTSDDNAPTPIHTILLDASPRGPGGLSRGWTTPQGRSIEAGIHGFWRDYANVYDAIENRIGLDLDDVLTPYTPSILVSQEGRVAVAPVLGRNDDVAPASETSTMAAKIPGSLPDIPLLSQIVQNLPPPLDVALLTEFDKESRLSLVDRISGLGLLGAWADFGQEDVDSWKRYDKISADQLFRSVARLSPALYTKIVLPLLHVLPMTTAYDCSASAALSCFHVFALQSRGAFDVRWCRGSIGASLFDEWARVLQQQQPLSLSENGSAVNNVELRGSARVTDIARVVDEKSPASSQPSLQFQVTLQDDTTIACDAVVLAVGAVSARNLAQSCEALRSLPATRQWRQWRGITCVAVRLFLQNNNDNTLQGVREAMKASPVVVCGPNLLGEQGGSHSDLLLETGFCIYDLSRLQDSYRDQAEAETVLEVDFFRADALADLNDDSIIDLSLRAIQAALELATPLDTSILLDSSVVRARRAVSHFCIGSAAISPPTRLTQGIYLCGDWVDRTGHASWSTEKAVVTARQAASALALDLQLEGRQHMPQVIAVPPDAPALQTLR